MAKVTLLQSGFGSVPCDESWDPERRGTGYPSHALLIVVTREARQCKHYLKALLES